MGQMKVVIVIQKRKLHNTHSRQSGVGNQFDDTIVNLAEVFRDNRRIVAENGFDPVEEVHAGAFDPFSFPRCLCVTGNRPVR